ncbi:MAG TPA: FHA domain-containing protein [bacterium]|nr:FHA domain-containing protein [bacterium]
MAKLIFDYPFMEKEYILDKDEIYIGRLATNDLSIPDYKIFKKLPVITQKELLNLLTKVSRRHAKITFKNGKYYIQDIGTKGVGSKYGTYVNEVKLEVKKEYPLSPGDRIRFGSVECIFED